MAYNKNLWINDETELNAENMNHIEEGVEQAYNVSLLAVSEEAPAECSEGDKYYNTEDKVIYTATDTDTWGATGEEPIEDILYVVFSEKNTYAWNGEDMLSVGGGSGSSSLIVVSDEEPTEDTKLIIEDEDLSFQGSEIVDEYSIARDKGYSAKYSNEAFGGKILWTNSSPTSSFTAQNITLNSDNYDTLEIIFKPFSNQSSSVKFLKGNGTTILTCLSSGASFKREITYTNDTTLTIGSVTGAAGNNDNLVPLYIIGYKTGLFSQGGSN